MTLPRQEGIILSSMTQQQKNGIPWFWVKLIIEWYEGSMVFFFLILIVFFLLRSNYKSQLGWNDYCHGYGNHFKSAILKVAWYELFIKWSTIISNIGSDIWKDSWRYYGYRSTYLLILSSINIMKQKLTQRCLGNY